MVSKAPNLQAASVMGSAMMRAGYAETFQEKFLAKESQEEKHEAIKKNQEKLQIIEDNKEDHEELVDVIQDNLGGDTFELDTSYVSEEAIKVGEIDPLFLLLARHPSAFKKLFPTASFTIEELYTWLAAKYGITYQFDLYYGTELIAVGQKIGTLDITKTTTIQEILTEMQYDTVNPVEILTLKPQEEFIDSYFSRFKGIYGTDEIWNYLSRDDKVEFYEKLENIFNSVKGELEFGGQTLQEIAYYGAFNEFLDRNDKYDNNGQLDQEWRDYLIDKVWNKNFKYKAIDRRGGFYESYIEVIETAFKASIFDSLIVDAKNRFSIEGRTLTNERALSELLFNMDESTIVGELLKSNLYEKYIIESFFQNFHTPNVVQILYYTSSISERNGALSEAVIELDFMSKVLSEIYDLYLKQGSSVFEYLIPTFSYEYNSVLNPNAESIFVGPRMGISQKRYIDEGIRSFVVTIGTEKVRIGVLSPVKHTVRLDRWENLISDAISGAFVNARDNIDKGVILNSELYVYLHSLRYELQGLDLTEESVRKWMETEYDNVKHKEGSIKIERQDVFESAIIKAINNEIWSLYGKDLSKEQIADIMRDELTEPDFVQSKIINLNNFKDKQSFNLPSIIAFIQALANEIDLIYSKIGVATGFENFEVRASLSRTTLKSDYFVIDEKLSYDQLLMLGIDRIYSKTGVVQNLNQMDASLRNTILQKQYRIISKEDDSSKALVEVDGGRVRTPSGYIDGIAVGGKFIRNALITYIDGRCLLSEFFDPELLVFGGAEFWLNEEYWKNYENHIKEEYVDIYTVFSFTESNEHRNVGTLVHLTDTSTRNDNLFYKLAKIEPQFQSEYGVSSKKASISKSKSALVANPFKDRDPTSVYGDEFTKEVFMEIFYYLFDPYKRTAKQTTQTLAMKFLAYLNGIPYGSNFERFSQGPSAGEINAALKKLSFTEMELQELIRKRINPKTGELEFNFKQTNKEWVKLLYDKITGYSYNDDSIYAQQRNRLKGLGTGYDIIDDSSIARNKKEFTINEAKMAVEIFESSKLIFGHFTIRLMFANMIDYYGDTGSFGIKILNRPSLQDKGQSSRMKGDIPPSGEGNYMRDFLYKIGLIPSTFQYDRPISALASATSKSEAISTVTYLFGFFYLESHIYLSIENSHNVKSSDNTLTFPLGPLISLSASGGFGGENLRDLSKGIGIYLKTSYESYRARSLNPRNIYILGKKFLVDQSRTLDFIAKKIRATIIDGNYYRDSKKNIWLANQLIESARLGLVHEGKSSSVSGYLRDQLESFMENNEDNSRQNSLILEFNYLISGSKKNFELEITQTELVENGIISWGKRAAFDSVEYAVFRAQLLHQNSHNIRKYLTHFINTIATNNKIDNKIRIFPLLDSGDSNIGYEFIRSSKKYDRSILPDGETYIDIDLSSEEGIYKLQHVINLLYTGELAFVVKDATGTWDDGQMIFAFNRDGFLKPNEIYSSNMVINRYSYEFVGDNNKWRRLWIYPKAWSANRMSQNNDFDSYINYIINSKLEKKYINSFIRLYMEHMEILFPNYLGFIKGYLDI